MGRRFRFAGRVCLEWSLMVVIEGDDEIATFLAECGGIPFCRRGSHIPDAST